MLKIRKTLRAELRGPSSLAAPLSDLYYLKQGGIQLALEPTASRKGIKEKKKKKKTTVSNMSVRLDKE